MPVMFFANFRKKRPRARYDSVGGFPQKGSRLRFRAVDFTGNVYILFREFAKNHCFCTVLPSLPGVALAFFVFRRSCALHYGRLGERTKWKTASGALSREGIALHKVP